ncbi:MAG: hypothetical protein HC840_00480 [Leptolyngbyaceae cyanobacterium RM2_2_4]|nr:hypothetical protein [Leptolyngbyaceae cyanobacterium RM2_2_4]
MKSVFSIVSLLLIGSLLVGCGQGPRGADGVAGAPGIPGTPGAPGQDGDDGDDYVPPAVTPEQADIDFLLDDENAYRLSLGQTELSSGLSCTVQAIASGQWLSSSSPGYNSGQGVVSMTGTAYAYLFKGTFNQLNGPSGPNSILPLAIQPLFLSNNYRIVCTGHIVVRETAYYNFELNSDDGSILTVNGTQVVNNDGNHGMTAKSGTILLRRGVRTFTLSYAQTGGGNFGLILKANGSLIDGKYYAH